MNWFTARAALLALALATATLTGCSNPSGSTQNRSNPPPASGDERNVKSPGVVADPPKTPNSQ